MNKFLSFLLCIFLLFGAVGCKHTPEQPKKSYEEQKTLYKDIISQYTVLLTAKHNGEELSAPDTANMTSREIAIAEALYGIVDACNTAEATENLGYGYKDLDENGTPELILLSKYLGVRAVFTISEDLPILLEACYDVSSSISFATQSRLLLKRQTVTDHIEEDIFYTCHVDGDKMIYDVVYGVVYDQQKMEALENFRITDGKRTPIDDHTFLALNREYKKASQPSYINVAKFEAPRIHFPLADSTIDPNLPVADFSDYAAIRKTYLAISTCIEEFNIIEWTYGKYDNLFSFPNDSSFEYYTKLLFIAYHDNNDLGYDEIDLNGDGLDELVLMDEDYRIKAIFTQKDGIPVLVDAFVYSYHTCWLDSDGLIHVDRESYEELEYSLYEFTKDGEYNLHYSLFVDNYGRYLTKDGKIEQITFEESLEIRYNDYVCYSEPFTPNEHTRSVSELTYTALTEATEDIINAAADKIWHKYASLEKTTGMDARSSTYVTFENVTDTQMDMSVKYAFTFSYPDPNRDHYYLDDTTESALSFTLLKKDGDYVFDENGMKGRVEFGQKYLWITIEESLDERFPAGCYCYSRYSSDNVILP